MRRCEWIVCVCQRKCLKRQNIFLYIQTSTIILYTIVLGPLKNNRRNKKKRADPLVQKISGQISPVRIIIIRYTFNSISAVRLLYFRFTSLFCPLTQHRPIIFFFFFMVYYICAIILYTVIIYTRAYNVM